MYDFLIIGAGLFGCTFAHEARKRGYTVLVVDRRNHLGGNVYCENKDGIVIHKYGPHIFHTNNDRVWEFVNTYLRFNRFINSPIATYKDEIFNLPFNMNTFAQMWGIKTPEEAKKIIEEQRKMIVGKPKNLEEQAIANVGLDIYETLIKGYTEKQWGQPCNTLPASIIERLPVRFVYDNNYFNDTYQGIPVGGYNRLFQRLLFGCDISLDYDFYRHRDECFDAAKTIVYTGQIDKYFNLCYGALGYRSLCFKTERLEKPNYQGVAVMNYTDKDIPYTRIVEHKHFEFGTQDFTYITKEYPVKYDIDKEPFYPINTEENHKLYAKYKKLADKEKNVIFGGRLAEYKYYNMDEVILSALNAADKFFS